MTIRAIRWSDNDRYWGPFTYARERWTGRGLTIELDSGDDDYYPGCRIRLGLAGHTLIVATPPIIKTHRQWHEITSEPTRSKLIAEGRRPGYWESYRRCYGFSFFEGGVHIHFGAQTHDSTTDKTKVYFLPWRSHRLVRHSLYDLAGNLFAHLPQKLNYREWPHRWNVERAITDACPTASFDFDDFDGERITATTKIEEREWALGEGRFKWLSWFRKNRVSRSLDIAFSAETGRSKGSWKGGTIGHSIEMLPGELHGDAFRRYCPQNNMTFIGKPVEVDA